MVAVRVNSGELPSAAGLNGNELHNVVSDWISVASGFPDDCRKLMQMVDETDRYKLWDRKIGVYGPFSDRNSFLSKRLNLDPEIIQPIYEALKAIGEEVPVPLSVAMTRAESAQAAAKDAVALNPISARRYEPTVDKSKNVNCSNKGGNNKAYRVAKLKRDHPIICEKLAKGGFKSVAAAERAAGTGRPLMTRVARLCAAYERLDTDEQDELKQFQKEIDANQ